MLRNSLLNYRLDRIYTEGETKSQDWEDGVNAASRQYLGNIWKALCVGSLFNGKLPHFDFVLLYC